MYTLAELNEACSFNRVIGAFIGIAVTLLAELGYAWVHGWF